MNEVMYKTLIFFIVMQLSNSFVFSQNADVLELRDTIPFDPHVRHGRLSNGFTYYLRDNQSGNTQINLAVKAGSMLEDDDQTEMAHLIEHVVLKGSTNFPGGAYEYLESKGLVPGIQFGASTGFENVGYRISLPSNDKKLLNGVLLLLRDMASEALMSPEVVKAEIGAVIEESRIANASPELHVKNKMDLAVARGNLFVARRAMDRTKNIKNFNHTDLKEFYDAWYRPGRQAVIIVGNIDVDALERNVKMLFGNIQVPKEPLKVERKVSPVSLNGMNQFAIIADPRLNEVVLKVFLKHPGRELWTLQDLKNSAAAKLLVAIIQRRLTRRQNQYNPPFREASVNFRAKYLYQELNISTFIASAYVERAEDVKDAFFAVMSELERVKKIDISEEELQQAKTTVLNAITRNQIISSKEIANRLEQHFFDGLPVPDPSFNRRLIERAVSKIDLTFLRQTADELISDRNRDIFILASDSLIDKLPEEKTISKWIKEIRKARMVPIKAESQRRKKLMDTSEIRKLVYEKEFEATEIKEIGVTELKLKNGIRVVLKPMGPMGAESGKISVIGFSPGGASVYNGKDIWPALNCGSIVANSGIGQFDKFQLAEILYGKDINAGIGLSENTDNFSCIGKTVDIETMLQLTHLYFNSPRWDEIALEDWKNKKIKEIQRRNENVNDAFFTLIRENRFRNRPGPSVPTEDDVNSISLDRVIEIYRDRFSNASDFTFVITGDFDKTQLVPLVLKYLGSLTGNDTRELYVDDRTANWLEKPVDKTMYKAETEKADVKLFFPGTAESGLFTEIKLEILAQALDNRLYDRLRSEEGAVYTVSAGLTKHENEQSLSYSLGVSFFCGPENVERVIKAAVQEVNRLEKEGLDTSLYHKVIQQVNRSSIAYNLKSPGFWRRYLKDKYLDNEDPTEILKRKSIIEDILTIEEINQAAKEYLSDELFQRFVLMPESRKPNKKQEINIISDGKRSHTNGSN